MFKLQLAVALPSKARFRDNKKGHNIESDFLNAWFLEGYGSRIATVRESVILAT